MTSTSSDSVFVVPLASMVDHIVFEVFEAFIELETDKRHTQQRGLALGSRIVADMFTWCESCPCHWKLLQDPDLPCEHRSVYLRCPLRGRRMPEIACGDLIEMLTELCSARSARMLVRMGSGISREERHTIVSDFEQGKSHIIFVLVLKTSHFQEPPWLVYGLGHLDDTKAMKCLDRCLQSACAHPFAARLLAEPLVEEARAWLRTGQRSSQGPLRTRAVMGLVSKSPNTPVLRDGRLIEPTSYIRTGV